MTEDPKTSNGEPAARQPDERPETPAGGSEQPGGSQYRREGEIPPGPSTAPPGTGEEPPAEPPPPPPAPPPRGPSLLTVLIFFGGAALVFWAGAKFAEPLRVRIGKLLESFAPEKTSEEEAGGFYTCGMHPWVVLPEPGKCPICHMDLVKIDPDKLRGEVAIDPRVVQSIGVRVDEVVRGPLVATIRTVGTVDYDETLVRDVNIKVSGWIEKLYVDYVGAEVEKGQPLFDIFSRELYDSQEQYLIAFRNREQTPVEFLPRVGRDARDLLEAARVRLEYYDITPEQIRELERRGRPSRTMTIVSPHRGIVISKHANEGMLVDPGMLVYRIADLSRVWVLVWLYEYQLPYVSLGQRAVMTLPYIPGQTFEGRVVYIYPYLDKRTRTAQVRLEFENPNLFLKPGMFARVELKSVLAEDRVLAPRSAIIDTGARQVAIVSLGKGRFDPREVRVGMETENDRVEVIDGLRPGELVVTSAQFLLDSEAKVREALAKMIKGRLATEEETPKAPQLELSRLPPELSALLKETLDAYFEIGDRLAADSAEGLDGPARRIASAVDRMLRLSIPEDPHFWHRHEEVARIRAKALELVGERSIERARLAFADLSRALAKLLDSTGVPADYVSPVEELHCPMYREGQGGSSWLQRAGKVRNPYFGSVMLGCFDERRRLPVEGSGAASRAGSSSGSRETQGAAPSAGGTEGGGESPAAKPRETSAGAAQAHPEAHGGPEGSAQGPSGATSPPKGGGVRRSGDTKPKPAGGPEGGRKPEGGSRAGTARDPQAAADRVYSAYLELGARLAADSAEGASDLASRIEAAAKELAAAAGRSEEATLARRVAEAAAAVARTGGLSPVRRAFRSLSQSVIALAAERPQSEAVAPVLREAYCRMARAAWLQKAAEVTNPYYGSEMLRCGEIRRTLPAASGKE